MVIVDGSRQRSIPVVLPGTCTAFVVRNNDDVQIAWNHIGDILRTGRANALQVTPARMRMEISDERQMRQVRQKFMHAPVGAPVFLDAGVTPVGGLIRNRMLHNVNVAAVTITQQDSETLSLVNLNR